MDWMCGWQPNVDVVIDEGSRTLVVRAELAGADSESLRVFLDGQRLVISGRRAKAARLRGGSFVQKEIADGDFMKSIRLPVAIAQAEITASYEDGLLTIALPISADEYMPASRTEIRMIVKRVPA
jgi:HSP20 family protein